MTNQNAADIFVIGIVAMVGAVAFIAVGVYVILPCAFVFGLANLDALFDTGLISFRDDGSMMISARIDSDDRVKLNLGGNLRKEPSDAMKTYLDYHRRKKFNHPKPRARSLIEQWSLTVVQSENKS